MALQVWLPLNGNLSNHGVENPVITNSGATVDASGKLGQCYSFGGSAYIKGSYKLSKTQSFACWVYFPNSVPAGKHLFDARSGDSTGYQPMYINSNQVQIGGGSTYIYIPYTFAANTWYHMCTTFDETQGSLYVNGSLVGTVATPGVSSTGNCNFTICSRLNQANYCTAKVNDVRIYNHCLSPKEVKEISKGLFLHYKMDDIYSESTTNLLNNAGMYTATNKLSQSTTATDGYFQLPALYYNNDALAGKTVTFSVCTDRPISPSHGASANSHNKVTFWLYLKTAAYDGVNASYTTPVNLKSSGNGFQELGGNRYSWTYTIPTTEAYKGLMIRTNLYSNDATEVSANFWDFQLELKDHPTPYTPSSRSCVVYDCSGLGHNGSGIDSTITYSSDSARYKNSFSFNGTTSGIIINNLNLSNIINSAVTYSFWIKPSGENGARSVYFGSYNGNSWSIEKNANNYLRSYWNGSPDSAISEVTITDGSWQHIVITKSGTSNLKFYLNGVLKKTLTTSHANVDFPTTFRIGRDTRANDGTPYKGLMSDFRIYATALSEDDVKDLYATSAVVCNNGTVMAYSLEE